MFSQQQFDCFKLLEKLSSEESIRLYLVGGAVRDLLRGQPLHDRDIDVLIDGNAHSFAPKIVAAFGGELKLFERFFTAKILAPPAFPAIAEIDLASARTEIYERPGELPQVTLAALSEDLRRRDFSINALALPLSVFARLNAPEDFELEEIQSYLLDPFNGQEDLESKLIRILHQRSFADDPTRLFRALRYESRIEGSLEASTAHAFAELIAEKGILKISLKRRFNEVVKMLSEQNAAKIVMRALNCNLLPEVFAPLIPDGTGLVQLLVRAFEVGKLVAPLSSDSAERLLLLGLIYCCETSRQKELFQALAVPKKLRTELDGEWNNLQRQALSGTYSIEGHALFQATKDS